MASHSNNAQFIDTDYEQNQYFCFFVAEKIFAVPVKRVTEIIELDRVRPIPRVPDHLIGVVNLRGSIIPIVSLAKLLGLRELRGLSEKNSEITADKKSKSCVVMIEIFVEEEIMNIGMLIDQVHQVIEMDEKEITEPPSIGMDMKRENIVGVSRFNEKCVTVLNLDKLFSIQSVAYLSYAEN